MFRNTFGPAANSLLSSTGGKLGNRKMASPALEVSGEAPRPQHVALDFLPPHLPSTDPA